MIYILAAGWMIAVVVLMLGVANTIAMRRIQERFEELTRPLSEIEELPLTEELEKPFLERVMKPFIERLGYAMRLPSEVAKQIDALLDMAGRPWGMNAVHFIGLRLLCGMIGVGVAIPTFVVVASILGRPQLALLASAPLPIIGFLIPVFILRRYAKRRVAKIKRELPDVIDLIVLSLEAGVGFDSAIAEVTRRFRGPLAYELSRVLAETSHGRMRSEALRAMAKRLRLEDISLLVAAVYQAETLGTSLSEALRSLATQLRQRRLRMLREQAAKLPVKLLFPLVLCIFPALLAVLLGPAAILFIEVMGGGR
ncbi:MAG: type II secretion system F family protein [Armatimonadota bacterium]|nr:type II secretion system F family protein [Armatimonadota bacterium]MCX7776757.1 type II secretion system F family protein [Armatimonadota bacterium]MDW8024555.1 type II secretion system F family protein [Armatimonadota bacterium]